MLSACGGLDDKLAADFADAGGDEGGDEGGGGLSMAAGSTSTVRTDAVPTQVVRNGTTRKRFTVGCTGSWCGLYGAVAGSIQCRPLSPSACTRGRER